MSENVAKRILRDRLIICKNIVVERRESITSQMEKIDQLKHELIMFTDHVVARYENLELKNVK